MGFITDSPLFISWFYAVMYGNNSIASYIARKDNYKAFLKSIGSYTLMKANEIVSKVKELSVGEED